MVEGPQPVAVKNPGSGISVNFYHRGRQGSRKVSQRFGVERERPRFAHIPSAPFAPTLRPLR